MKTCRKCGESKPLSEYYGHPTGSNGLLATCKTCVRRRVAERYAADPTAKRAQMMFWRHGMTANERRAMGDCCRICGARERLCVDHDHRHCGPERSCALCRRGLLCHACNQGLGQFKDDIDLVLAAVIYLLSTS